MKKSNYKMLFQKRAAALKKYNDWEQNHFPDFDFQAALDGLETLLALLPEKSQNRPFDPQGIITMHQALAHIQ